MERKQKQATMLARQAACLVKGAAEASVRYLQELDTGAYRFGEVAANFQKWAQNVAVDESFVRIAYVQGARDIESLRTSFIRPFVKHAVGLGADAIEFGDGAAPNRRGPDKWLEGLRHGAHRFRLLAVSFKENHEDVKADPTSLPSAYAQLAIDLTALNAYFRWFLKLARELE